MSKIEVNTIDTQCGTNLTVGAACKSVTVAGNDIRSNSYKAADGGIIISQSGTNITLGASGDTISLAAGATQTGFGRTGTVDWDTTAKTTSFTAVSGNGYFVNTTSGAITVTLPAGSAGDIVALADYASTWQTNSVSVVPNGTDKIGGNNSTAALGTQDQSVTLVYTDSTQGWKTVNDSTSGVEGSPYITATGGTITTCGNYKIHTFTGPGSFSVSYAGAGTPTAPSVVDYLVVAGGGGGGANAGGGGGGGGFRESHSTCVSGPYTASPLATPTGITITATTYPITVGAGGSSCAGGGYSGANSIFSTITSAGGGFGGGPGGQGPSVPVSPIGVGGAGGSGGGGSGNVGGAPNTSGGAGNTPPTSPSQGTSGGNGGSPNGYTGGGGGGGATTAGTNYPSGNGGPGATTSISKTPTTYAGGGGGGGHSFTPPAGAGGAGGGGAGAPTSGSSVAGTANTGGGGGAGANVSSPTNGSAGGSGIVIIRYKYQ